MSNKKVYKYFTGFGNLIKVRTHIQVGDNVKIEHYGHIIKISEIYGLNGILGNDALYGKEGIYFNGEVINTNNQIGRFVGEKINGARFECIESKVI